MAEEFQIGGGAVAKVRNPLGVVGLSIITLGIYFLFWWYYINREMHDLGQARNADLGQNPTNSVLAIFPGGLIIVPAIVTEWTTSARIEKAQRTVGVQNAASGPVIFLLLFLIAPVGIWYAQNELNKAWDVLRSGAGAPSTLPPAQTAPAAPFSDQPPAAAPPPQAPPPPPEAPQQ